MRCERRRVSRVEAALPVEIEGRRQFAGRKFDLYYHRITPVKSSVRVNSIAIALGLVWALASGGWRSTQIEALGVWIVSWANGGLQRWPVRFGLLCAWVVGRWGPTLDECIGDSASTENCSMRHGRLPLLTTAGRPQMKDEPV